MTILNYLLAHPFETLQTLLAFIALVCGFLFVCLPINSQWKLQKRAFTVEVIHQFQRDQSLQADIARVMEIARVKNGTIAWYAMNRTEANVPDEKKQQWNDDRELIIRTINRFEAISIGAHEGLYDQRMIALVVKNQIVVLFRAVRPFIQKIREQNPDLTTVAKDFEKFAKNLEKEMNSPAQH